MAYEARSELVRLAVLQGLREKPEVEIKEGYENQLRKIAEINLIQYNECSLSKAADFFIEDVKRFKKAEESLEEHDKIVYQPSLEQIQDVLSEAFDASKLK